MFLLASQLIAQQVFWLIPIYSSESPRVLPLLFTPWSNEFPLFFDLYAHWGVTQYDGFAAHAIALAQYLAFTVAICFWLRFTSTREWKNTTPK